MSEEKKPLDLNKFVCQKTGVCCRQPGFVYLNDSEAKGISDFLKVDERELRDRYCDLADRRRLVLKKDTDESCIFLRDHQCQVYSVRPNQCRDFPRKWRTEASHSYCAGLRAITSGSLIQRSP